MGVSWELLELKKRRFELKKDDLLTEFFRLDFFVWDRRASLEKHA